MKELKNNERKIFNECLERMEILKLSKNCINAFKKGEIWESEGFGALYEINDKEKKIVEEFEKNNNYKVYHLIHNVFEFGECYTILFVSGDIKEWARDKKDLKDGYVFAYVKNVDDDWCSEFGSVVVKPNIGGLVRIG